MSLQKNQNTQLRNYTIYQDYIQNHLTYDELALKYNLVPNYVRNICNAAKKSAAQFESEPAGSLRKTNLSTRILNALSRIGIFSIDELKTILVDDPGRIEKLPHLGIKGMNECRKIVGLPPASN